MIITGNYLLIASIEGEQHFFEYETNDVWSTLEQFWHEDYPEKLIDKDGNGEFPIDVLAMENGKVIKRYPLLFTNGCFHAFFDKGHTAYGPYTLDQFAKHIWRDENMNNEKA